MIEIAKHRNTENSTTLNYTGVDELWLLGVPGTVRVDPPRWWQRRRNQVKVTVTGPRAARTEIALPREHVRGLLTFRLKRTSLKTVPAEVMARLKVRVTVPLGTPVQLRETPGLFKIGNTRGRVGIAGGFERVTVGRVSSFGFTGHSGVIAVKEVIGSEIKVDCGKAVNITVSSGRVELLDLFMLRGTSQVSFDGVAAHARCKVGGETRVWAKHIDDATARIDQADDARVVVGNRDGHDRCPSDLFAAS